MTRFTLAAVTALMLAAAPVVAQTTPAQAPVQRTTPQQTTAPSAPASSPTPGSEEWLRLRGESYSAALRRAASDECEARGTWLRVDKARSGTKRK